MSLPTYNSSTVFLCRTLSVDHHHRRLNASSHLLQSMQKQIPSPPKHETALACAGTDSTPSSPSRADGRTRSRVWAPRAFAKRSPTRPGRTSGTSERVHLTWICHFFFCYSLTSGLEWESPHFDC
ncbi:hypothetical protein B0T14DRAFT_258755 [Immersiella caudata]|uniref:Uncharacterized protein n=1 Tax=Immersiella caudata TaxID=314043 RepID=A0AA40BXF1_9PEZI|nr:hypothetical protein B0T14DRAFT_258755 [Immersiella caudata]